MAYVPVPKDLSKIKTKVAFNLTKRQIICFAAALAMGLMVCEVVSSVKSLRQCKSELNICRFIAAPERGHQHFPVRLVRVLDIVKGFF